MKLHHTETKVQYQMYVIQNYHTYETFMYFNTVCAKIQYSAREIFALILEVILSLFIVLTLKTDQGCILYIKLTPLHFKRKRQEKIKLNETFGMIQ